MKIVVNLLISVLAIVITAYLLPGTKIDSLSTALMVALVLGILNAILRPILTILTLPITILTLGLFSFVLNALMILLVSAVVPGFYVDGFFWALLFSFVLSLVNTLLNALTK